MRERVAYTIFEAETVHLGLISGLAAFLWGCILLFAGDTFSSSLTYDILNALAPEWLWGCVLFTFGIIQTYVTLFNKHWIVQASTNFFGINLWFLISIIMVWSNPVSTAGAVYPILGWISVLRLFRCFLEKDKL